MSSSGGGRMHAVCTYVERQHAPIDGMLSSVIFLFVVRADAVKLIGSFN